MFVESLDLFSKSQNSKFFEELSKSSWKSIFVLKTEFFGSVSTLGLGNAFKFENQIYTKFTLHYHGTNLDSDISLCW